MAKRKRAPEDFEAIRDQVLEQLTSESDRGCVLIAAAMLDESLEFLLRQRMEPEDDAAAQTCINSLFDRSLASFGAKIQLARALGFIEQSMYEDLERIRTLRNLFAHSYEKADFADARVIALTERLAGADIANLAHLKDTPVTKKRRILFTLSVAATCGFIHGCVHGKSTARIRRH